MEPKTSLSRDSIALLFERIRAELIDPDRLAEAIKQIPDD